MSNVFPAEHIERHNVFRAIFEQMSDPNLLLRQGRFVECNAAALKLLGYPNKNAFLNLSPSDISPPLQADGQASADKAREMIDLALRDGRHRFEWAHQRLDGTSVTVEVMLTPIQLGEETVLHTLWRDVTERAQLESTLRRQVEMLKRLNDIVAISGLRPKDTMRQALRIGADYLKLEFGIVSHIQAQDYEVMVQVSPPETMTDGLHFVTANTYCNETLQVGDVLAVPDVPHSVFAQHPCYRDFGLAAYIGAPIWVHGEKFGTINFSSPNALTREFGPDIDFVRLLARWAGAFLERMFFEEELELASSIYQHSSEGMLITDADNNIVAVNPALEQMTGYTAAELKGKNPRILQSGRHPLEFYQRMWESLLQTGAWQGELWNRRKNGEVFVEKLSINTIYHADGTVRRWVALLSDITEQKRTEELIWRQANFDALTALPNRRMFYERLQQELKKAHRTHSSVALLFIDLDHFKEVNDTLGHDAGDALLVEAAQRITHSVREVDTVARLGGDEFTVILSAVDNPQSVERVAQTLVQQLQRVFLLAGHEALVSASIGIALYPQDAGDAENILKNADRAMYESKRQGRSCYRYFNKREMARRLTPDR